MAGVKGNKNAIGNKGGNGAPTVVDRELSKKVRRLTLKKIEKILSRPVVRMDKEEYDLYKQVLLKLAGNILPRLNEHSGPDGGDIPLPLLGGKSNGKNTNNKTIKQPKDN